MGEVLLKLTTEQAALLKDQLEYLVECTYDSCMDAEDEAEAMEVVNDLININQNLCAAAGLQETDSLCYQNAKLDCGM